MEPGGDVSLTRSKEFAVTHVIFEAHLDAGSSFWLGNSKVKALHVDHSFTLGFTNLHRILRTRQPLSQRLPKRSVDTGGNIKLATFGEVKANCTKWTWEVGLAIRPLTSATLNNSVIPTSGQQMTPLRPVSPPWWRLTSKITVKNVTEKNAPFFSFYIKQFPIYYILVSENEFGGHCSLHFPRHRHEDKDPGWLALAWLHQDTDLNGPTWTRNRNIGVPRDGQAAGHTQSHTDPWTLRTFPGGANTTFQAETSQGPWRPMSEWLGIHRKQALPPVHAFLMALRSRTRFSSSAGNSAGPREGTVTRCQNVSWGLTCPSVSNLCSVPPGRLLHTTEARFFRREMTTALYGLHQGINTHGKQLSDRGSGRGRERNTLRRDAAAAVFSVPRVRNLRDILGWVPGPA